jgi:hypothetical protein
MGVPWGASKDQVIKAMSEQGYRQLNSPWPDVLAFRGAFAGAPCQLLFRFIVNSFYSGEAENCGRSDFPGVPLSICRRTVGTLSEKYGPPQKHESGKQKDNNGEEHLFEYAIWNLVDSRTSDKYTINVQFFATWFNDIPEVKAEYITNIEYTADSLRERLEKKGY